MMLHLQLKFCDGKPADNVAAETVAEGELWSLFMTLKSLCEPAAIHNDNMGILDGLWKGEECGLDPMQKEAPMWIKTLAPARGSRQVGCATRR